MQVKKDKKLSRFHLKLVKNLLSGMVAERKQYTTL